MDFEKSVFFSVSAETILFLPHIHYRQESRHAENPITPEQCLLRVCLRFILEVGVHSRQYFLVGMTDQVDAFFNPKMPDRRKLQINNQCPTQILIEVVSRNADYYGYDLASLLLCKNNSTHSLSKNIIDRYIGVNQEYKLHKSRLAPYDADY